MPAAAAPNAAAAATAAFEDSPPVGVAAVVPEGLPPAVVDTGGAA